MKKTLPVLITLLLFLAACGKEEFAIKKQSENATTPTLTKYATQSCSTFSVDMPKVDFLFLWDNSSSQFFINDTTKAALGNLVTKISPKFDAHIMIAPLIVSGSDQSVGPKYLAVTHDTEGLSSAAMALLVPLDQIAGKLTSFQTAGSSMEPGFDRAMALLNAHKGSDGIFRQNAHTIIVTMSNGNDSSGIVVLPADPVQDRTTFDSRKNLFDGIKTSLNAIEFRYMTLVAHSPCTLSGGISSRRGTRYIDMSNAFGISDSYDICATGFEAAFNGINSAITDQLVKHVYNYWPAITSNVNINEEVITVTKVMINPADGSVLSEIPLIKDDANGFKYIGYKENWNTRIEPSIGEPATGVMIELFGSGKATYPECIRINTQAPYDYYGYIALEREPDTSTIVLTIDGVSIGPSSSNGWEYVGFANNKNIRVDKNGNTVASPAENRSGYFLKLSGSAVYSNNSSIAINYRPVTP